MDGLILFIFIFLAAAFSVGLWLFLPFLQQQYRDAKASVLIARRKRLRAPQQLPRIPPIQPPPLHKAPQQPVSRQGPKLPQRVFKMRPIAASKLAAKPASKPVAIAPQKQNYQAEGQYTQASSILSRGEQAFFVALRQAVGNRYSISPKVRIADLVKVKEGPNFYSAFNPIAMKHIDFVLMHPTTFQTLLLVELDDKTHRQYQRQKRDKMVNQVCTEAGLRIIHIKARADYQARVIADMIEDRLRRR